MSAIFDKKRAVTIQRAIVDGKKENYQFFQDTDGKYGDANTCYLRFRAEAGIYEGQKHVLSIKLVYGSNEKHEYPTNAPLVQFITPIWHPNVSSSGGSICLDILKDKWVPTYSISQILNSLRLLLEEPNPSSPMNPNANKAKKVDTDGHYEKHLSDAVIGILNAPEFDSS